MVVRETFSSLSMRLLTEESSSELVGTEIVCSAVGLYCGSGVYCNEPRFQARGRSEIHYGAVWLKIIDERLFRPGGSPGQRVATRLALARPMNRAGTGTNAGSTEVERRLSARVSSISEQLRF
jgi:hypothetical protein